MIGDHPPEFILSDLNGKLVSLYQFKGKVVVLYFWADWCCRERTLLTDNQFYQKYKEKGLVILAINSGQPKKVVERFVKERNVAYDVLLDLRFTATKQYGVVSLPMIFVLDRDGIVRNRILGQVEFGYLEKAVLTLL
jgi:peroxiredoxin